jgi:hypothetical protein
MWSTGYSVCGPCGSASTTSGSFGSWGVGTVGSGRPAGWTRCWVLRKRASPGCLWTAGPGPRPLIGVRFWWARLFFENCTVDASISGE